MTNPIWVVKVRMFTTRPGDPLAYRDLWHGLSSVYRIEGMGGLYRGTSLALFGVSSGALQFMGYEEMKRWGFDRKRKQYEKAGQQWTPADDKLVSLVVINFYNFVPERRPKVQYCVYRDVRSKQAFSSLRNLPLPSSAIQDPRWQFVASNVGPTV
ncbi:hypothetical protein PHLCEN_2v2227 [Hermanssonia centrifuga]|uniref:Uncharacterized protein n=1 Tax=Hermanssonia centrifuga TaxID=98765 RepID=A0A2R6RPR4_9APHY|nr:hypothetical protein PHLCEN_2v2227 [Hermanssonia centrifuga]